MHDRLVINGSNFDGCVPGTGGGSANQQWNPEPLFFHGSCDCNHFFQRWSDQAAQSNDVGPMTKGFFQNPFAGDHDPKIDDSEVIAAEHHCDNVLADVMHITLDRGNQEGSASTVSGLCSGSILGRGSHCHGFVASAVEQSSGAEACLLSEDFGSLLSLHEGFQPGH